MEKITKYLNFHIIFNGIKYEMPNCRLKVDSKGRISALIRDEYNKWKTVKADVVITKSK